METEGARWSPPDAMVDVDDGGGTPGPAPAPTPAVDRKGALATNPTPFPRKAVFVFVAALALAVLLVTVVDHFVGPASSSTTAQPTTSGTTPLTAPIVGGVNAANGTFHSAPAPNGTAQVSSSLSQMLGLQSLHDRSAPAWTLTDAAAGRSVSLQSLHGHVVILSFLNGNCQDICPVLATELKKAATQLGSTAVPVTFVTINTDPLLTPPTSPPILKEPDLHTLPRWRFLTGSVHQLNPVWKHYGISITVDDATHQVSHNDLLYFISPAGKLVWSAQPFADESQAGTYSLRSGQISRFAKGVASYAKRLATSST